MTQEEPKKKEMLSVSQTAEGKTLVKINTSSLSIIQSCLREAHYALDRELRSEGSSALNFGSAIHKALEVWYSADLKERSIPKGHIQAGKLVALGHYSDLDMSLPFFQAIKAFGDMGRDFELLEMDDARSLESGGVVLAFHFNKYRDDGLTVISDEQGPIIERTMRYTIYEDAELEIEYHGTLDVALENKQLRTQIICDHKTSSRLGNSFFNRLKPNHQYTGYLLAAKKCLNLDTDQFMVNALGVYPKSTTTGEYPRQCIRQITDRREHDYQDFKDAIVYETKRYLKAKELNKWPQSAPDPCVKWGGCDYQKLCEIDPKLRENVIRANWKE